jgi:prepilin-type N-terminal cleavage/methylation domain-containing protein
MKSTSRRGNAGFTLIELMAVITIIVILAGLVVGGLGYVSEKQAKEKARVQLALLSKGLEAYKLDMGVYPVGANTAGTGNTAASLYVPLFYEGYDYGKQTTPPATWTKKVGTVDIPKSTTIYIADLNPTTTKQGWVDLVTAAGAVPPATTTIKDPWGAEYRYRSGLDASGKANTATQNPDFDLWSCGKDGLTNTTPTHQDNRDDIKNF